MHDLTIGHRRPPPLVGLRAESLRLQQLKNYFTLLLLSAGAAMFVMGDEFARTQDGDPNPYDVDGRGSWVDWDRSRRVGRAARVRPRR